jgi:RNA polymerase sigma-70 factor (ECF subfamily)
VAADPADAADPAVLARELAAAIEAGVEPGSVAGLVRRIDALFLAHRDVVYAACHRAVGDRERALELAQDSLLRAYQKLPTFRGDSTFRAWLVGIARYECVNASRKRRELLTEDGVIEALDPASSALAGLRRAEREELLRDSAAAVLDPVEQEVIALRYVEQVPLEQIDRLLRLPEASGARGVLQRCRRKLGRELRRRLELLGHASSFLRDSGS